MASVGGMAAPAKALSARDKEKLKEKLASLQREYRKTFSRLQRAERAERVKSYVKKTVVEQNRLLLQAVAEEDPAGTTCQAAPETTKSTSTGSFPKTNAARTPSVTFRLEAEVYSREGPLPDSSGAEWTDRGHERRLVGPAGPVPEKKPSRLSRRRGQRAMPPGGRRAPAHPGETPGPGGGPPETGPQSPAFVTHGNHSELDPGVPQMTAAVPAKHGGTNATPVATQLEDLKGPLAGNDPSLLCPRIGNPLMGSRGPSLEKLGKGGVSPTYEHSVATDTVLLANVQNVSKEEEDEEDLRGTLCESKSGTCRSQTPPGGLWNSGNCRNSDSPPSERGKKCLGGEAETGSPFREDVSPAAPACNLLGSSCTVIEGLLFPVEYYVRTTRRMSSCQREPNLAAVIQSQLGRRRKGRKASPKERVVNPAPSSQGVAASGELSTPPDASRESGSGSGESPAPGKGPPARSRGLTQRSRRGRRKGRGQSRHGAAGSAAHEPSALAGHEEGNESLASSEGCQPERQSRAGEELAQKDAISLHRTEPSDSSVKCKGERTSPDRTGGRRCGGTPDPASCSHLGVPGGSELPILMRPPSDLELREFHLPEDEFGLLQSEKVRASVLKPLEIVGAGEPLQPPQAAEGSLDDVLFPAEASHCPRDLHTSRLLLSPGHPAVPEGGSGTLESQEPTPLFPVVGATPATPDLGDPSQHAQTSIPGEPGTLAVALGTRSCDKDKRCLAGVWLTRDQGSGSQKAEEAAGSTEERRGEPAAPSGEHCRASAKQTNRATDLDLDLDTFSQDDKAAEDSAQMLENCQGKGNLWMTSELKDVSGSCSVDMSVVWWETADFMELCVVTACETSVALWRHLDSGCWENVHTWSFAEMPVFRIVPLPGAHSLVCVALGGLEMAEIRLLSHSPEDTCPEQLLVKAGNIKAVLGLSGRRLVSSSERAVEVLSFPAAGGCGTRQALFPPEETTLAFAAVDEMAEALVGLTAANFMVVWNLTTGQLLSQIPLRCAYPVPVCHQAYSDSGLLFVILSHLRAEDTEPCGSPAFQVLAFNPKTARSSKVMDISFPPGIQGRFVDGAVRGVSAAAVLSSGSIAVWDLSAGGGECRAVLRPPRSEEGRWARVRWSLTAHCLLAARTDGRVCLFAWAASGEAGEEAPPAGTAGEGCAP